MTDKISNTLTEIILGVEKILWLDETNDIGLVYAQADLVPVLSHVKERSSAMAAIERSSIMKRITSTLDPLYKITSVLQFKTTHKLNYADYASMDVVKDILIMFTIESEIKQSSVSACNAIADVLHDIDSTRPNYKNSLSYKYLRVFLLLVIMSDFINASCIATFILTQLGD